MLAEDISSISGSDTESSDASDSEQELLSKITSSFDPPDSVNVEGVNCKTFERRHQKLFFRNAAGELIALKRCTVYGRLVRFLSVVNCTITASFNL